MGRLSSNVGLITGTNISSTVDQLIKLSAIPRDRVTAKIDSLKSEQVVVNELTALVVGVQLQTTRLAGTANLSAINVSSSNEDVISVVANSSATEGTYQVRSVATAQASSQISSTFQSKSSTLSTGSLTVRTGGFIDRSTRLEDLRGGDGVERGRIQITNRAGETRTVDLRFAVTANDVVDTINRTSGLKVNASLSGDRIVLSDITGQSTSNLIVEEVDGGRTAADLGFTATSVNANSATGDSLAFLSSSSSVANLLDGRGLDFKDGTDFTVNLADGSTLNINLSDTAEFSRLGQVIDAINTQGTGKVQASIAADGVSLRLVDQTTGSATFSATGSLADSLGFTDSTAVSGAINGRRIQSSVSGSLLSTLNGGKGLEDLGTLTITNRNGTTSNIDLSNAQSLDQIIKQINDAGAGVVASYNRARTGIRLQDTTGAVASNLIVTDLGANSTATKLGIERNVATNVVDGTALNAQFVSRQTKLSSLNQGRGVSLGSFTITNSAGTRSAINLATRNAKTVGDVIDAVNSLGINVEAKLNESGDGFYLIDNAGGAGQLIVAESGTGTSAADLKILGTSTTRTIDGQPKLAIESKQNYSFDVDANQTLESLVSELKADSRSPIQASLLNTGGGSVRLVLTSKFTGSVGRVFVDGESVGISTTQSAIARDAVISVGAGDEFGGTLVSSSTNKFDDVLPGIDLTVEGTSSETITVNSTKSFSKIESNLKLFVDQYNKVIDKLAKETAYDATTQKSGFLFGSSAALRVEQSLSRFVTGRSFGTGKIQSLSQLGIAVSEDGKLSLDTGKLNNAVEQDSAAVEKFFSDETRGFSARGKALLENLVGVDNGLLINRSNTLQRQVEGLSERVDAFNIKLSRERTRLTKQFTGMESAIAKLQSNLDGLRIDTSLFSSNS